MVYSSSLMETNFFTMAQTQARFKAAEEAKRLQTIQQLNKVCGCCGGGGVGGRASLEVCVCGGASSTPQSGCCWY